MYNFIYEKVNTIEEVEKLLNENEETKILAGGQTLIPTMKQRLASPSTLIDISGIDELNFINDNGNSVTIGSTVTHHEVSSSDIVMNKIPSLPYSNVLKLLILSFIPATFFVREIANFLLILLLLVSIFYLLRGFGEINKKY